VEIQLDGKKFNSEEKVMKKILVSFLFVLLMISNSFAVVELDGDSNGATDINKGGTNATTVSGTRSNFEIDSPSKSFIINEAITSDDFLIWLTPVAITITDIKGVLQSGINVVGGLDECNSNGADCVAVDSDITFDSLTSTTTETPLSDLNGYFWDTAGGYTTDEYNGCSLVMLDGTAAGDVFTIDNTAVVANRIDCTGDNLYVAGVRLGDSYRILCNREDDGGLTNGTIAADHWVRWHTTSVSSPGFLTVTIDYTID